MVRADLLPAGRQFHLCEERVAVDHIAELEAEVDERLLDGAVAVALDFGRQDVTVHELTLAGCLHLQNCVGRVADATLSVHGTEQVHDRMVGTGIAGAGHERTS